MSKFSNLFKQIGNAKVRDQYTDRMGPGTHKVVLERYEPKVVTSQKNNSQQVIIEADFTVLESDSHKSGETKGWTWFPGDEYGYQDGDARQFIETVGKCVGDDTNTEELGEQLSSPSQPGRGVVMTCTVKPLFKKDGTPLTTKKGEAFTRAFFTATPNTLEQVAEARKELDEIKPLKMAAVQPQPQPEPKPAPSPGKLLGALGRR